MSFDRKINRLVRCGLLTLSTVIFLLAMNAQTADWKDKLIGKWKLNLAKSQYQNAPQARPMESDLTVSQVNPKFKWNIITTLPGGHSMMGFDDPIDGKPHAALGTRGAMLSFVESNGMLEGNAVYPGGMTMHETIAISQDGNTMTSESKLMGGNGTISWTEVWERVPQKTK